MSNPPEQPLLEALLDSWDRNNTILTNLLDLVPVQGLGVRTTASSPSIAELFTHIHYARLALVQEDAPEFAKPMPEKEWVEDRNRDHIAQLLNQSALAVRQAVESKIQTGQQMDLHYDHPILLLQHMIWHEGYHHGQIKLALKAAGMPIANKQAGPLTWRIWMNKK
jgi:uncharacterized damage-inducible protein DinB